MTQRRLRNWLNTFHSRVAKSSQPSKKSSSNESWGTKGLKIKAVKHMDYRYLIDQDRLRHTYRPICTVMKMWNWCFWWLGLANGVLPIQFIVPCKNLSLFKVLVGNMCIPSLFPWNILLIRPNTSKLWLMVPSVSACCLFLFSHISCLFETGQGSRQECSGTIKVTQQTKESLLTTLMMPHTLHPITK